MSTLSNYEMKLLTRKVLFSLAPLLLFFSSSAQVYEEYLLSGWTFKSENADIWLPAEVPGSVQRDLQLNGREVAGNMNGTWQYNTHFIADEHILARDHVELMFKGLDTHADVYLNGDLVLRADNMFRSWVVPVKDILKMGKNKLQISFKPNKAVFDPSVRKASYHFKSADSSQIPLGIWKPIVLQSWNTFKIAGAYIEQKQINSKEASLTAIIDLKGAANSMLEIEIFDEITNKTYKKQQVNVQQANQQLEIPFTIRNPKLWWPVLLGDQNLYVIGIRIKGGVTEQTLMKRIGLREVQIDASSNILSPSITINGKSVILKGIHYQPSKLLSSQMNSNDYDAIFDEIIENKLNTIHVSGEGIYESEYFYDLADTRGILILQDFMFSNHDYPATPSFIENVKEEVKENIKILKQHPSLILWTRKLNVGDQNRESALDGVLKEHIRLLDPSRPLLHSRFTDQWNDKQ